MSMGKEWVGSWIIEAPLRQEEWEEDKPILDQFHASIPAEITIANMTVWVHGREYRWDRVNVTTIGTPPWEKSRG